MDKFEILLDLIFTNHLEDTMKKLLALLTIAAFVAGCVAKQPVKEFHPTDDVNANAQGGKGETSDGSEVDFGLDEEPAKVQYEDPKKYYPKK